jgi:hypothetical protein
LPLFLNPARFASFKDAGKPIGPADFFQTFLAAPLIFSRFSRQSEEFARCIISNEWLPVVA